MIGAYLTTAAWVLGDQRSFIRKGFDGSDIFQRRMVLPRYSHSTINQKFPLGARDVYFLHHPDHIREAFVNSGARLNAGSPYEFLRPYFGDELVFVIDGARHVDAKQRLYAMIRNDLTIERKDLLFFDYSTRNLFPTGVYPVLPAAQAILSAFIIRAIFGVQGSKTAEKAQANSISAANNASTTLLILPTIVRVTRRFGVGLQIRRQRLALRRFILTELEGLDIISDWETALPNGRVSRGEIVDNLMTLLIAGFETAATTFAWLLYELASNSEAQTRLRDEVQANEDDILAYLKSDRSFLSACVSEALRLHPSIPFVLREVNTDHELGGQPVRKGDYILVSIDEMQRRHFGENGDIFDPARFLGSTAHPKILAFGGGVKTCPGRALAVQLLRLVTAMAIAENEFYVTPKTIAKIARNRVSAAPEGGMVLGVRDIR